MLVDNKFLFLKIPRTGTVAFERSCRLAGLSINYPNDNVLAQRQADKGLEPRRHSHERVSKLREYFGNDYPIIALNRDPLDRFLSAWKYIIKFTSEDTPEISRLLTEIDNTSFIEAWQSEIGYSSNLQDLDKCSNFFKKLIKGGLPYTKNTYMIFTSVMTGPSRWHENDSNIKYIEMRDTLGVEQYIREATGKPFEFIITNHTKTTTTNIAINDDLRNFYFKYIEPPYKITSTLL